MMGHSDKDAEAQPRVASPTHTDGDWDEQEPRRGGTTPSRAVWHTEAMRTREVFRYLEPWEANIRPTITSTAQTEGKEPTPLQPDDDWTPVGCEDTALAAFAQLGALRLNAQRCIISLISKDQEVVLAESTRTLSLQSDLVHIEHLSLIHI